MHYALQPVLSHFSLITAISVIFISGCNAQRIGNEDSTPLYIAVTEGKYQVAERLLKDGADPNETRNGSEAPMVIAVSKNDTAIVQLLLSHHASVQVGDQIAHRSLAGWAAAKDSPAMLDILARNGVDLHAKDESGSVPLSYTTLNLYEGNLNAAMYLVGHGANVNELDKSGFSILSMAVQAVEPQLVAYLLGHGANPNLGDFPALSTAISKIESTKSVIKTAQQYGNDTQFEIRQLRELPGIIQMLIDSGADLNRRALFGETALYAAASACDTANVSLLLRYGADRNLKCRDPHNPNDSGKTPLDVAKERGCEAVVRLLE